MTKFELNLFHFCLLQKTPALYEKGSNEDPKFKFTTPEVKLTCDTGFCVEVDAKSDLLSMRQNSIVCLKVN